MEASKVYYTSFKTSGSENLVQKLRRLCITAGMKNIDFEDKYAAIKIHFGELGNLAFLRPNYAKVVVDLVKECGGKAFLTDCNTLYVGSRKNALDHMDTAYENGFTPAILDTLKEKKVKAIFFVTYDFAKDNPKLIKRMIDEGHIVGNHTYRHYTMDEVSEETATEEIMYLHNYIKKNFNYEMKLFRFPKGEFSQSTLALAKNLGYKSVFWSFAYADWDTQNQTDETTAYNEITKYLHPGEIMLLHAVSKTNASVLGKVIDEAQKEGYKFTVNV